MIQKTLNQLATLALVCVALATVAPAQRCPHRGVEDVPGYSESQPGVPCGGRSIQVGRVGASTTPVTCAVIVVYPPHRRIVSKHCYRVVERGRLMARSYAFECGSCGWWIFSSRCCKLASDDPIDGPPDYAEALCDPCEGPIDV